MSSSRIERVRGWMPLAVAAACLAPAGCINGPLNTVRSTAQNTKTGQDTSKTWANLAELSAHDRVGPDLEYRVSEQVISANNQSTRGGVDTQDSSLQSRPTLDLLIDQGPLRWSQHFEHVNTWSHYDAGADNSLARTDLLEKLEWSPYGMPTFTGWIDRRTVEDDQFIKQQSLDSLLKVEQTSDVLDYEYAYHAQQTDDLRSDTGNKSEENALRATWRGNWLHGKLDTTLSAYANARTNTLQGATSTTPGLQVFPLQGISGVDLTPQIAVLTANAALIDGNDLLSAGINIGGFSAGGELGWNIGVRLPAGSTVDALQLVTVGEVPASLPGQFAFSVWASDDNSFWTEVASSTVFVYDPVIRSFRLTIPPVTQAYLKLVNTASPPAAPAVLASELRVYTTTGVSTDSSLETRNTTENANGSISWHASDKLTLGYDFFVEDARTNQQGTLTNDQSRFDNGLWALWNPYEKIDASLRLADQYTQNSALQDEETRVINSVLTYHPLDTLDTSASYSSNKRLIDGDESAKGWAAQALASARLLDTLRADLTLERSNQDDVTNERLVEHWIAGASLIAELTPHIELTLGFNNDAATVSGLGAAAIPNPSEDRTRMIWLIRASQQLTAQAELDWIERSTTSGLDTRSRVDWIPFQDGALNLQLDLNRLRYGSTTEIQIDQLRALLRYTITPRAFLEFNYSVQDPSNTERTEIFALAFNFAS